MANFLEQMESNIFDAQITRLARKTGKTPDKEFMRAMYYRVKERYKEELQKRKIVLRQLDAVRLDEIVSYVFYYHLFHTYKEILPLPQILGRSIPLRCLCYCKKDTFSIRLY